MKEELLDKQIVKEIESSRQTNSIGSKVTYDLSNFDFSRGRAAAYALAETVWEKDLKECWTEDNGKMQFHPKYDIEIRLPQDLHHHTKKIISEIQKDLEDVDMWNDLQVYCYDNIKEFQPSLQDFFMYGFKLTDYIAQRTDKKSALKELAQLYSDMSAHIKILN